MVLKTRDLRGKPNRNLKHACGATSKWQPFHRRNSPTPYRAMASQYDFRPLRFNSSASLTKRQSGTANPSAIESATFTVGFRSNRSIREIILGARSALSARVSCDNFCALRYRLTTTPKAFAKFLERISTHFAKPCWVIYRNSCSIFFLHCSRLFANLHPDEPANAPVSCCRNGGWRISVWLHAPPRNDAVSRHKKVTINISPCGSGAR